MKLLSRADAPFVATLAALMVVYVLLLFDFARAPFGLSRPTTCTCGPGTGHPNAAEVGTRCRSDRRNPSTSPTRRPSPGSTNLWHDVA